MGFVRGVATLLALLAFIGVVAWAWSKRSQKSFEAAANLPLQEDDHQEPRP